MNKNTDLSTAAIVQGYLLHAESRRMSQNTIKLYAMIYRKFAAHVGEKSIFNQLTVEDVETFLSAQTTVSDATLAKYHITLSSLFTWAVKQGFSAENLLKRITCPRPEKREIVPFTIDEIRAMLSACDKTAEYTRAGKATCANTRPTALRDRAIILLLVDTGLRATELCDIQIHEVDLKNRQLVTLGKGDKERLIPFDARTGQALWRYIATRPDARADDPLFVTGQDNPLDRKILRKLMLRIGQRAGVKDVHPHRFRHTFAINYLRNKGDIYTLQRILGHSTLEMVKRYLAIANVDVQNAHRLASPVANWRL